MSRGWQYFATRLNGDGTETLISPNIKFSNVGITRTLSGIDELSCGFEVEREEFKTSQYADWTDFVPWETAIYAMLDGLIRAGGIVKDVDPEGEKLSISCVGFIGYLTGMPQTGGKNYILTSPWTIAEDIWSLLQAEPGSNLGMQLVTHGSNPIKLGQYPGVSSLREGTKLKSQLLPGMNFTWAWKTPKDHPAAPGPTYGVATRTFSPYTSTRFCVVFNSAKTLSVITDPSVKTLPSGYTVVGLVDKTYAAPTGDDGADSPPAPYSLHDYDTPDLGEKMTALARLGQFDFTERHELTDGDLPIKHYMDATWPSAGSRRSDLRFVVGENVMEMPGVEMDGDDYANEVLVQGAGEGSSMIRQSWSIPNRTRLRRVKVITDPTLRANKEALSRAQAEGKKYAGDQNITQLLVANHPNAPLGSWGLGDILPFRGNGAGWAGDVKMEVRVLSYTLNPETNDFATVTVARKDKAYNSDN